ncbi:Holliday junction branch migration protein RuvA [Bacteroidales bacterium OttesenSCG-928-I21]|nr:Holliday junction branch migration protein RuvA [Bacteroidales bacterium OttesenSCG-928-I21]
MFEYIKGLLIELNPATAIVENNGFGYFLNISLNTYSKLKKGQECKLYIHEIIREDTHALYAFDEKQERELFRALISVSGIGANTARLVLSSVSSQELIRAITEGNVDLLKSIKGIGVKTAQRIILDLRDKLSGIEVENIQILGTTNNTLQKDALTALTMLGFSKPSVEKVLNKLLNESRELPLEELVKLALNYL